MEGLEATEVRFSNLNKENRLDAEYFSKNNISLYRKLCSIPYTTIGEIAFVTDGIHSSIEYSRDSGINLISATSPKNNLFDLSRQAFITANAHENNPRTALQINDVVVSTVGTIGNSAVVRSHILPANSDRHVGIIRILTDYSPYFLSTFLLSKYGRMQTLRESTGNVQLNLFLYKIRELIIPAFSVERQKEVVSMVIDANEKMEASSNIYVSAENYLLECLGMQDFVANPDAYNIKTLKESFLESGRIDAEYYLHKYEDYANAVSVYSGGVALLSEVCTIQDGNYTPQAKQAYRYIELANIGKSGDITGCLCQKGEDLPTRARRLVRTGDVIVSSIEGSLGSCALVTEDYDHALCSTGFYVVRSFRINSETLLTLFKSEPIQQLLKKGCSGTILTGIGKQEFEQIPIPLIRPEVQEKIAQHIQRSFALRKKASQLLEEAKLSVERAIEMGGGG